MLSGVVMTTLIYWVSRLQIGERPLDNEVSWENSE